MQERPTQLPWEQPGWIEQASAWIGAELSRLGITMLGPLERVSLSRWSIVLRAATSGGAIYFKATFPLPAHEPALTQALARWHPDDVPRVLAADPARGWLLLRDEGMRMREVLQADRDLRHWQRVLPRYAALQLDLAARLDELLALGVPDRRPALLPAAYDRLVRDTAALRLDGPMGLTSQEQQRLLRLAPRFAALCAELARSGVPMTLHHGDLHDGNILVRDGRYRFFDWGNACIAHPFVSLRTALKRVKFAFGLDDGDPELAGLRDAYLEPWPRFAPRSRLLATLEAAHRVGMISNALTWQHVLAPFRQSPASDVDEPAPRLLREFLTAERDAEDSPSAPAI